MDFLHTYLICGLIIGRSLAVAEFQTTQEFMFSMEILSKSEKLSEIKPPLATAYSLREFSYYLQLKYHLVQKSCKYEWSFGEYG